MSELDARCLDAFPQWLRSLSEDVLGVMELVQNDSLPAGARRQLAGAVNYLFKSLDLIPDGIEDLGFIDDAFVLRVAAARAKGEGDAELGEVVGRLSTQAGLVRDFLGDDYFRLDQYVGNLTNAVARGRSVDDVLGDSRVLGELISEVKGWASSYEAPSFSRDEKNLIKLRSFLKTKLPA